MTIGYYLVIYPLILVLLPRRHYTVGSVHRIATVVAHDVSRYALHDPLDDLGGRLELDMYTKRPCRAATRHDALESSDHGSRFLIGIRTVASRPSRYALRVFFVTLSKSLDYLYYSINALLTTHLAITHAETRNHIWYPIQGSSSMSWC